MTSRVVAVTLAAALTLLGAWSPQAPSGNGSTQGGPSMNDMNWTPPSYNLSTTNGPSTSGAGGINRLGTSTNTNTVTPQCVKVQGAKLSEGSCADGKKTVSYADGCGGTIAKSEACTKGIWAFFWAGNAPCSWACTGGYYDLKCVEGFTTKAATDCGRTRWPKRCIAGHSHADSETPQCPASWDVVIFGDGLAFWEPGGDIVE